MQTCLEQVNQVLLHRKSLISFRSIQNLRWSDGTNQGLIWIRKTPFIRSLYFSQRANYEKNNMHVNSEYTFLLPLHKSLWSVCTPMFEIVNRKKHKLLTPLPAYLELFTPLEIKNNIWDWPMIRWQNQVEKYTCTQWSTGEQEWLLKQS